MSARSFPIYSCQFPLVSLLTLFTFTFHHFFHWSHSASPLQPASSFTSLHSPIIFFFSLHSFFKVLFSHIHCLSSILSSIFFYISSAIPSRPFPALFHPTPYPSFLFSFPRPIAFPSLPSFISSRPLHSLSSLLPFLRPTPSPARAPRQTSCAGRVEEACPTRPRILNGDGEGRTCYSLCFSLRFSL